MSYSKVLFKPILGDPMPVHGWSETALKSALNYIPQKDDLFVVGYPRVGATLIENIVMLIKRKGEPFNQIKQQTMNAPFIDLFGADKLSGDMRPITIKTHLPYDTVPKDPKSLNGKYIVLMRNPKDVCVSYYLMYKNLLGYEYIEMPFDYFFDHFIDGSIGYGNYFDNVNSWYDHRNDPNVKVMVFEEIKSDIKNAIKEIAQFMGQQYEESYTNDLIMNNILKYSSIDYIYDRYNNLWENFFLKRPVKSLLEDPNVPESIKEIIAKDDHEKVIVPPGVKVEYVRKGAVNDWKNFLSDDQSKKLDEMIMKKLKDTHLIDVWKKNGVFM